MLDPRRRGLTTKGFLVALLVLAACSPSGPRPLSTEEALQAFRLEEGFAIELFAAEPQVASPVAIDFDEDGRAYVAEMPGYPLDTRPTGRIRRLEDRDGDGRADFSTVFADGLVLPSGVMAYRRGVLVTAAPDVLYLADEDGDGRAERREPVLTGFAFTNPQHTVNSPLYGLDNWIYLAHEGPAEAIIYTKEFGDPGRALRFPGRPEVPPLEVGDHGVRIRPATGEMEALSGSSQFGHSFDEWGRHFTLDNSNHLRHEVIGARYLERNPVLALGSAMHNVSDHGSNAVVYPITRRPRFELLTEPGEFTSACGLLIYLGGAFPEAIGRSSFVAEPAQNLVHRDVWSEAGSTFTARRAREGVEFLASTDSWFRPVYMTVGPEGALYLVDYYRQMIEHPEWMSSHVHDHSQQTYAGQDRGRIWRIRPAGRPRTPAPRVRLGAASDEELVNALSEANLWWRRTAQRLIVDGKRESAIEPLQRMLRMTASPVARVHALYTLDGLGALSDELVDSALRHPEAGVREIGIRLAEARLARSPTLAATLLGLVDDPSPKVRFQLLLTLGSVSSSRARAAQDRLLLRDLEDPWVQAAALSASPVRAAELLTTALQPRSPFAAQASEGRAAFYRLLGATVGARPSPADFARALRAGAGGGPEWWRAALLEGLARGTSGRSAVGLRPEEEALLAGLAESETPALRRSALDILQRSEGPRGPSIVSRADRARALARDPTAVAERRADAVRLLALAGGSEDLQLFTSLTDEKQPPVVQAAAVRAMSRVATEENGSFLIARWGRLAPPARSAAADFLLQTPKTTRLLVDALRRGEVPAWTLSFGQKRDLIMNTDPGIRADARPLLEEPPGGREAVRERYEAALDLAGDPARGERVFTEVCSKCHRAKGKGQEVGPDLGSVRQRAPALLLGDILLPSRAIAQNYESYVVETDAGETHVGVVASQSPTAVVLRREGGEETLVSRDRIVRIYASDLSSMPADLEQQVDLQEMADLLAFIGSPP